MSSNKAFSLKILILAMPGDPHVEAVDWALRQLGHAPVLWYWSEFPKTDISSLRIGPQNSATVTIKIAGAVHSTPFDVIWKRRLGTPAPMDGCHPDDVKIVISESERYLANILPFLSHSGTRWVNHPDGDYLAKSKVRQLAAAVAVGFAIPNTLIGNDIDALRQFFDAHNGRVVNKAFTPALWINEDGSRTSARTSVITSGHLEEEYAVRASPGIYQQLIDKKYELRVTVMGDAAIAAAIYSQAGGATVDWRYEGGRGRSNLKAIALEPGLRAQCIAMCRALDIAFGCIDLIVDDKGQVVFLEVNEGGQFLFNETSDPQIPMLDAFCRFLIGEYADTSRRRIALQDYHQTTEYHASRAAAVDAARTAAATRAGNRC